jgi:hypothetical protein
MRFEGSWQADKKNGLGVLVYRNLERSSGEWKDDRLEDIAPEASKLVRWQHVSGQTPRVTSNATATSIRY